MASRATFKQRALPAVSRKWRGRLSHVLGRPGMLDMPDRLLSGALNRIAEGESTGAATVHIPAVVL